MADKQDAKALAVTLAAGLEKDLGAVSAYAIAVEHGYEGTEEEWAAEMQKALNSVDESVASAQAAKESADAAAQSAKDAQSAAEEAAQAEASISQFETDLSNTMKQSQKAEDTANNALSTANTAKATATSALSTANTANATANNAKQTAETTDARLSSIIADGQQTEGNTELIDIRTGFNGELYTMAGDAVRGQVESLYDVVGKNKIYSGSVPIDGALTSIKVDFKANAIYELRVTSLKGASGYFNAVVSKNSNMLVNINEIVSDSSVYKIGPFSTDYSEIVVRNINTIDMFLEIFECVSETMEIQNSKEFINPEIKTGSFIGADGEYSHSGYEKYKYCDPFNTESGDTFVFSGGYEGWSPVSGYDSDNNFVKLLGNAGYFTNEIINIDDSVKKIGMWSDTAPLNIEKVERLDKRINENGFNIFAFTVVPYQTEIAEKGNDYLKFSLGTVNENVSLNCKRIANTGDKVFVTADVISDKDINLRFTFYSTSTEQSTLKYTVKANVKKKIIYCSNPVKTKGTLNFIIQAETSENANIEIKNIRMSVNSFKNYITLSDYISIPFKDFNSRVITVGKDGISDFDSLSEACEFAKIAYDVINDDVLIYVKSGVYYEKPTNVYPCAAVYKGANRISIIGEDPHTTIIYTINTAETQSKVIDIGGPCVIKNLTIKSLKDESYTAENDLRHNCYCIHNDTNFNSNEKYETVVENCILYSACHSPVGAGLQNNQTQVYKNCKTISDGILSAGSLYVHASANPSAQNMAVIIDECTCISEDGKKAITLPNVKGSLPYTEIDTTIQRTIAVSNGENVIDENFKEMHKLTKESALNNIDELNA